MSPLIRTNDEVNMAYLAAKKKLASAKRANDKAAAAYLAAQEAYMTAFNAFVEAMRESEGEAK